MMGSERAWMIAAVRVITGTGEVISAADVVVRGGRIERIVTGTASPPDGVATVIDGRGRTLIPGLIDAHCHLDFLQCRGGLRAWLWSRTALPKALGELVACGITSIRTMADPPRLVFGLRRRAERERITSPRLVCAGPALTAPGGHPQVTVSRDNPWLATRMARGVRTASEGVAAVRRLHRDGADLVKIVYQGGTYADEGVEIAKLPAEAARAIIGEAHRLGLTVSAHTHYEDDVRELLEMGVDSIEHGVIETPIDDPGTLSRWAESGAPLVATLAIGRDVRNADGENYVAQGVANLRAAHRAGVRIAAGTDSMVGAMPADTLHDELRLMVDAGLTPHEALRAATAEAARLLRLDDRGVVSEGAAADLVLLGSDPLEDIGNIGDIELVIRDGRVLYRRPGRKQVHLDRFSPHEHDLYYRDGTGAAEASVQYSCAGFAETGSRTLTYRDSRSGSVLRSESIESDEHLVTRRWICEIPAEGTRIVAKASGDRIVLSGIFDGEAVSRAYPLLGRTWMQGSAFDMAPFVASDEDVLEFVSIGTSGHGALELTEFELTKVQRPGSAMDADGPVMATLVMPRWRRWWSAELEFDPANGSLLVARMAPGKEIVQVERALPRGDEITQPHAQHRP